MKFCRIIILVFILFHCCVTHAQDNFKKLDNWLAVHTEEMGGRDILLICKNGKIVYSHTECNLNMRQKMLLKYIARKRSEPANLDAYTPATQQPIASCSKWLSTALVMTFIDDGQLKLTDTVGRYLPILSRHGKGNITIADCLSHLTGIDAPGLKDEMEAARDINSMEGSIEYIASLPVEGQPGNVFHYSSVGLQIAGAIVEKISGKGFNALFQERIAKPLAMVNTDFGNGKVPVPAGSGNSTPNDYMNFLEMILNKGMFNGKRILSEKSIAEMQVNRQTNEVKIAYTPAQVSGFGYGLGEWIMTSGVISSPGLFGSFPWVDNKNHYAAFLMTYYLNNKGRDERFMELKKLVDEAVK